MFRDKKNSFSRGGAILSGILEIAQVVSISLIIVLVIKYYLIQPFMIKGASMEPNFQDGNYIVADEISYRFQEPARGEVVVFHFPFDQKQYFIKRIIGLPGETVEIKDKQVIIHKNQNQESEVLSETYLPDNVKSKTEGSLKVTLKESEFFVMGDNRFHDKSSDSRSWGPVEKDLIVGKVWFRIWIIEKIIGGFKAIVMPS